MLVAQTQVDAANKKKIQPTESDNWQSKFDLNGKNPYDTYLMQKLIKSQFKSSKIVGSDYQKAFKDIALLNLAVGNILRHTVKDYEKSIQKRRVVQCP